MYAIVEIGGSQCKVEKNMVLRVPKINEKEGKSLNFNEVLLVVDKDKVEIGTPFVKNAVIKATILAQGKDKKVMVFKKKRRKNYKVKKGHRQDFTELRIDSIGIGKADTGKAAAEKPAPKKEAEKSAAASATEKTATAKADAPKKAPAKKPAAKKTSEAAPKKAAAKKPVTKAAPKKPAKTVEKKKEE